MFVLASFASDFQQTDIIADWQGAQSGSLASGPQLRKSPA